MRSCDDTRRDPRRVCTATAADVGAGAFVTFRVYHGPVVNPSFPCFAKDGKLVFPTGPWETWDW